jgi:hypothetical protein
VALGLSADAAFGLNSTDARPAALDFTEPADEWLRRLLRRASVLTPGSVRMLARVAAHLK